MKRSALFLLTLAVFYLSSSGQPSFPEKGQLFVDTTIPRVDITVSPDTLIWLYANPESDREFRAAFVFDNGTVRDTMEQVGFRLRGNTSRWSQKKSFKISFNTFTPGGNLYGVEKMNLNGEHNDPSIMRSKIMWDILRKWDIPAPRSNHVQLFINGNYFGLYINVEHIDEEFAMSRFGNKNGNLYKCLYPADLNYRGDNPDSYKIWSGGRWVYELKTNEEENDFSDLAALIGVLHNSTDENLFCDLNELFNIYDYLKIMAVQIFCGDWDGYIYNKNNFYLYHNTLTGKLEYIPYDVDNTLGIDWFGIDWAERNIYTWQPGGSEERPLYDRIINHPVFRKQFSYYAKQLISSTLDIDSLKLAIEARKVMISPYVATDPYYPLDYGYDYGDFLDSYTSATGAHDKWGLYPYLEARMRTMAEQIEEEAMDPVINYIRHQRISGEPLTVTAFVEAAGLPVSVTLLFAMGGGPVEQTVMTRDGSGTYTAVLTNISGDAGVTYQVMASDGLGRTIVLPCKPVHINPVTGNTPLLFINEFMADNEKTVTDEYGNYSDWIEIFNGGAEGVYLGDIYLTDNFNNPHKWRLPGVILPAGGFIVIWADGMPALGTRHASFKLSMEGEEIGLYSDKFLVIDTLTFGLQHEDVSMGRKSDGGSVIGFLAAATPGRSNNLSSAETIVAEEKLTVWPNPAGEDVIWLSETVDCRVYNSTGVLVFAGKEISELDVSQYRSGLYIIVTTDGRRIKFIVR